jgi:hypothetical protein
VNLYAESSAVLAWLLDEPSAATVRQLIGVSEITVSSDLTLIECDRVLLRAVALKELVQSPSYEPRDSTQSPPMLRTDADLGRDYFGNITSGASFNRRARRTNRRSSKLIN